MISMELDVTNIELKKLLKEINYLLIVYTSVHNLFIEKTNGIFSIFKKINFNELKESAIAVGKLISNVKERIDKFKSIYSSTLTPIQKECHDVLVKYSDSLSLTVAYLVFFLSKLQEKKDGKKLTLKENAENFKKYNKSIQNYLKIGIKLNELIAKL